MAVKKYIVSKKTGNFTVIPNHVLQNLRNYEALGLYCYIASLPPNFEFHKEHLRSHAKIGRDKLNSLLSILEKHALIRITQVRNAHGQFAHFALEVDDGSSFKINGLEEKCAPLTDLPLTASQSLVNSSYKRNIEKTNKQQKRNKSSCASDEAHESFERFYDAYPKKKDKPRALKVWLKNNLHEKAEEIIEKVEQQKANESQWKDSQFIPYPSTYLNNERWKDEITLQRIKPEKEHPVTRAMRAAMGVTNNSLDYDGVL